MLRIHLEETPDAFTLRLEGRLAPPWAQELVRVWLDLKSRRRPAAACRVDLSALTFVDPQGRKVLAAMAQAGCRMQGAGPLIAALLEEGPLPSERL